jgi:hypothetical protein
LRRAGSTCIEARIRGKEKMKKVNDKQPKKQQQQQKKHTSKQAKKSSDNG